ncbi:family 16 glycoside hydrolase [Persicitalea jodogahamensis]|uniref:PA14 domain-containing protein n=1 Tax=Persicitalea jodogahamensis TaxID=402147 RepID=A0A8J3D489_9BACT|nr:family 16 glycoside hydrolase [Persicitalea jodogahamensis]GHB70606.1 hypothetical protein GCM10007390_25410 [Persicitalea jodogahamensis]
MRKPFMITFRATHFKRLTLGLLVMVGLPALAQTPIPLNDLSAFTNKAGNWSIVGNASVDITQPNVLNTTPGKGVLACIHKQGTYGPDYELLTKFEHGDLDIEMDYMMAKGSNSGIYLQGNYEVQLFDSWGKKSVNYSDNGGIYHRWDDAQPEGQKGYEGYSPRLNVSKAPGLWQHISISYQAPRFDKSGKKITNAVFLKVELNGMTIHENVEVSGPTRGALGKDVPMGPLRIQGDHGSLAIKNIVISNFDKKPGTLSNLQYKTYYGNYSQDLDPSTLKVDGSGNAEALTWDVLKNKNNYVLTYTGTYNAPTAGDYTFRLQASGNSKLKIDGKEVLGDAWKNTNEFRTATTKLSAGNHKMELYVNKRDGWLQPVLGLWVAGPGFREVAYHNLGSTLGGSPPDPILVDAENSNTVLRSFMDIRPAPNKRERVVHAVSVGSPSGMHYTYDMDKGALFQVWRGDFLDATPMWNNRGDGSSRPRGSVTLLGDAPLLAKTTGNWPSDTTESKYRQKGYELDANDVPTFRYEAYGTTVSDRTAVVDDGRKFEREIKLGKPVSGLMARLAEGDSIEKVSDNLYAVDNKSYYIQLADNSAQPEIKKSGSGQSLVIPVDKGELKYSILF